MYNTVLLSVTGKDKPGITSSLTEILSESNIKILDIEQVVIHDILSLSLIIKLEKTNKDVLKDLLFKAKEIGINLDFEVIEENFISRTSKNTYVITCLGNEISALLIFELSKILSSFNVNIEKIYKLNEGILNCLEMVVNTENNINLKLLKQELLSLVNKHNTDIAFQKENLYRKSKRLLVLDMDMTLIQIEVIDQIASLCGKDKEVHEITELAMNGIIDFDTSLIKRVSLLEGLEEKKLELVYKNIKYTEGAKELIKISKELGYKVAVISGGFTYFTERIKKDLGLDYAYANTLEIKNGKLTGEIKGQIINAEKKAEILCKIAKDNNISLDQVIAVGDGANDIPMLQKAGLGIAFNAKPKVKEKAKFSLSKRPLSTIFYLLGINEKDMKNLL
ncbi:MAG: phosphoserine phosphatase SerB [Candidatus Sericytochromatia bacterium]|nr:MAG: phosphoserine phosphatase SerB [Candidatus Sericytochromatia bacterium]